MFFSFPIFVQPESRAISTSSISFSEHGGVPCSAPPYIVIWRRYQHQTSKETQLSGPHETICHEHRDRKWISHEGADRHYNNPWLDCFIQHNFKVEPETSNMTFELDSSIL